MELDDLKNIWKKQAVHPVKDEAQIAAMLKPQFEAGANLKHKGVIKNDSVRRDILREFETWAKALFVVHDKRDSDIAGTNGNRERFYLLSPIKR